MPRPEQMPEPRAPEDAEHGATAALQELAAAIPDIPIEEVDDEEFAQDELSAIPEDAAAMLGLDEELDEDDGDLNDGLDQVLFAPSDRPEEPITQGVPFGPGASFIRRPPEDEQAFADRVAQELEDSGNREAQMFARRLRDEGL